MVITPNALVADAAEVAKNLSNPVANMSSLPFQFNYDLDIGLNDKIMDPLKDFKEGIHTSHIQLSYDMRS